MNLKNGIRLIAIAIALGIQLLIPAPAASHREAPAIMLDTVDFEGSGPLFDAGGNLVAVERIRFSGVDAAGHEVEGSGRLSLLDPAPADGAAGVGGILDGILGRVGHIGDTDPDDFSGRARVAFDSISVGQQSFIASGSMRLQLQILQPVLVHEFEIEADLIQDDDGHWRARFHGTDSLGTGVGIDGFFVPSNEWGLFDDGSACSGDVWPDSCGAIRGNVEALALLEPGVDALAFAAASGQEQFVFDDTDGAEQLHFVYDDRGRLSDIVPSAEVAGRFRARLTLHLIDQNAASQDGLFNIQVDEMIFSESVRTPDGQVSGRAEVLFSGVGESDGIAVRVGGTAEFRFFGETVDGQDWFMPTGGSGFLGEQSDGNDWFMAGGEWRMLNARMTDAETGGALLFEDISGRLGPARIVGGIDTAGQVELAGGLGQVVSAAAAAIW